MTFIEQTLQDLCIALRGFRRNPTFALTAILVIAIGIGSAAAVFSFVDRLLFRSLPYPESENLVSIGVTIPIVAGEFLMANDYFNLNDHKSSALSAVTSWTGLADCDITDENPQRLACAQVESTFLPTLGITPLLGQNFTREDDGKASPKVALLSYGMWNSRFGKSPQVVGQTIPIDGVTTRIIGVLPRDFELPNLAHADLVVPQELAIDRYRPGQSGRPLRVLGRLLPGITPAQATPMIHAYMMDGLLAQLPPARRAEARTVIRSLRDYQTQDVRLASWTLFAATLAILLIACANVTNLLWARSLSRRHELATRKALGAGRGRLVRQMLAESTALSLLGALPGCGLAWLLLRVFRSLAPLSIPRMDQASLDTRVMLFALAITFGCALVYGLASGRDTAGPSKHRLSSLLMTIQVAVSMILLAVAGLLVESLVHLQSVNAGMGVEQVMTADITVGPARHPNTQSRQQFFEDLASRLRQMPGVEAVAVSDTVPPSGFVHSKPMASMRIAGQPIPERGAAGIVAWRRVSPEYFAAMKIPMLQGRSFQEQERTSAAESIVMSELLARKIFGNSNAIGRQVTLSSDPQDHALATVVGVCRTVPNNGLAERPDPEYYLLRKLVTDPTRGRDEVMAGRSLHLYDGEAFVIVRSSARGDAVAQWIRSQAAALDNTVPVTVHTMQERMQAVSERPRFSAALLSIFALVGVVLAAGGLYGLTTFLVVQRTRELGVRVAIGATPRQIGQMIIGRALRWTLSGVVLGSMGAAAAVQLLRSMLFQVKSENPLLFAGAALLMVLVAAGAALAPTLKAARTDPVLALRHD